MTYQHGDTVVCTDASGGIVGWLTKDMEYVVESVKGNFIKLVGCVYSNASWRFKLKDKYGNPPINLGEHTLRPTEMCFVQYLPIRMQGYGIRIPENLHWVWPLLRKVDYSQDDYIYLTAKYMYQTKGDSYNRPGFHTDGFGTEDINYLWSDCNPTEFYVQDFNLSDDHEESMVQMAQQALATKQVIYPDNTLLKLNSSVVHRVNAYAEAGMRAFVKISVSKDKYNLIGNSHNYLYDYDWQMVDREITRNCPQGNREK